VAAIVSAVQPAVTPWPSVVNPPPLLGPAGETYPGGVNDTSIPGLNIGSHTQDYGPGSGSAQAPPGDWPDETLAEQLGLDTPAGVTGYTEGEPTFDAASPGASQVPMALPAAYPAWDSNAGGTFGNGPSYTPSHYVDTGGVHWHEHVNTGNIGRPFRRTVPGQVTDRQAYVTDGRGFGENVPGDRTSLDQYQGNHWPGWEPHPVPYLPRENYLNIATGAQPHEPAETAYMPGAYLPDMSNQFPDVSVAYETPPDPYVSPGALYVDTGIDGGWA
jgi:hypothetical protein